MRTCVVCAGMFGHGDDLGYGEPVADNDWRGGEGHGRCYRCYLDFLYGIYGGYMEPAFRFHGDLYTTSDIVVNPDGFCVPPDDLPF